MQTALLEACLNSIDDYQWAEEFLLQLHNMDDERKILNIYLYYPAGEEPLPEVHGNRIWPASAPVDIPWVLNKEWGGEAGNMLASGRSASHLKSDAWLNSTIACGTPDFELQVRKAVRRSPYDIDFRASVFQPGGT